VAEISKRFLKIKAVIFSRVRRKDKGKPND